MAEACFLSGLRRIGTEADGEEQRAHRPELVLRCVQDRWIEPQIVGRPLSLLRCPSGLQECFFQKHAWKGMPATHIRPAMVGDDEVLGANLFRSGSRLQGTVSAAFPLWRWVATSA